MLTAVTCPWPSRSSALTRPTPFYGLDRHDISTHRRYLVETRGHDCIVLSAYLYLRRRNHTGAHEYLFLELASTIGLLVLDEEEGVPPLKKKVFPL